MRTAFLTVLLLASTALAQLPTAIITGPKESRPGSLVILDASESTGLGRMWLLAVSPEETSFLPVEAGLKCIFASPTPGDYTFVLVVAGTNSNSGPAAAMATHTVTLIGPSSPPVVVVDPTDPPLTLRPTAATYIYEKDQSNPPREVQSAISQLNESGSLVASVFEQDTVDGDGEVPDQYRAALTAAQAAGLPCLVVLAGDLVLRVVRDPKTVADVLEAVK